MQKYDKYDIIIENITKEISSMIDNNENKSGKHLNILNLKLTKPGK